MYTLSKNSNLFRWVNFADIFGRLNAKLLASRGFTFSSENAKLNSWFHRFAKKSKLQRKIEEICYHLPANEFVLVGFDKFTEKNYYPIFLAELLNHRTFALFEYDYIVNLTVVKEIYEQYGRKYWRFESWTDDKVRVWNTWNVRKMFVPNSALTYPLPNMLHSTFQIETNPLGLIPWHDFRNHSFQNVNDWNNLTNQIEQLNSLFDFLNDELKINRRMVFARVDDTAKFEMIENVAQRQKLPPFVISGLAGSNEDHRLDIVSSNLNFGGIQQAIDTHLRRIFDLLGYSYNYFAGQSVASDIMTTNSAVASAIKLKRRNLNSDMTLFLEKIFKVAGFKSPKFRFELNDSTQLSEEQFLRLELEKIRNGLSSRESLLKKFGLDSEETKEELKKAKRDKEFWTVPKNQVENKLGESLKTQTKPQGAFNQPNAKPIAKPLTNAK